MADIVECADTNSVAFTYSFLKGIDPSRPPASITIPQKMLDAMGNMERQYWEIKSKMYNVMIFFKKGKFYELYDYDAVIANREFGLKMVFDTTNRGKMRLAGVPEQSLSEWARLFVFRGYKVGRVEQLREDEGNSPSGVKAKVVPRELVEVLTPGTLTDPIMLSDHSEVFILSIVPDVRTGAVDAFAADLSRRVVYWCPCGDAEALQRLSLSTTRVTPFHPQQPQPGGISVKQEAAEEAVPEVALRSLSALLQQLHPKEIITPDYSGASSKQLQRVSDALVQWIEGESFLVERIPSASLSSSLSCGGTVNGSCGGEAGIGQSSPARQLLCEYFHTLRLDRSVPLLNEATLYEAHLASSSLSPSTTSALPQVREEREEGERGAGSLSLLQWERKHDTGLTLDASTVSNLEVVANLQDGSERQTLNHCLNACTTNGGKRLFRSWLLRPSASARVITARQEVVRFLREHQLTGEWGDSGSEQDDSDAATPASQGRKRPRSSATAGFEARFAGLMGIDIERHLSRLCDLRSQPDNISYVDPLVQYRKNVGLILSSVQAFTEMVAWAREFRRVCAQSCAASQRALPCLLDEILQTVESAAASTAAIDCLFDRKVAEETERLIPAAGTCPEYDEALAQIGAIEAKLHAARRRYQQEVFRGADVRFADTGSELFLLEVAAVDAPKVPPQGMVARVCTSKSVKYSVVELQDLVKDHKTATTALSSALLRVLCSIANLICDHLPTLYTATSAVAYFDCLMNLTRMCDRYTGSTLPTIVSPANDGASSLEEEGAGGCAFVRGEGLVHPLLRTTTPVPNSIYLDREHGRVLVLTGPNMAGKSTLMRTVAVNVLLAQLGGPVLGREMVLCPVQRIFTRIGARDASHKGQSTLFVELGETAEILRCANGNSLCLIDELGRGTSTHDGLAIAHATLHALQSMKPAPPLTLFSTHYHSLAREQQRRGDVTVNAEGPAQLGYMDFALSNETHSSAVPSITFLYQLVPGICARSYGVEVAMMAGIPPALVELAKAKSTELARRTALHEDVAAIQAFLRH